MCCINIRDYIDQFYQFIVGVPQRRTVVDEILQKVSASTYSDYALELNWL